ncbi:glycerate kinase type-2 family protein [Desulfosediminicola flagellatus]|uniref:glycerate kinase type-2 family protein n=1 Tax=Desulfosediminicola flagellatus TaxID=2569541 RepID=UPI001C3E3E05|nr:glycerate kinase [Desulfosediminicola flagellatus]
MSRENTCNSDSMIILDKIFRAGLLRVDPYQMIKDQLHRDGSCLSIHSDDVQLSIDLDDYTEIVILGAGKATAPMARAMEELLGERLTKGLVVVKYGHTDSLKKVEIIEAGHPVPDAEGVRGAGEILQLAADAGKTTLVINLISGGGSALLPYPGSFEKNGQTFQLSLSDKQKTTQALLACGAEINEINCVRKHLSGIKGGRLLDAIAPARSINLILSDVVGDDLSSIASGMTAADPTTFTDALSVLQHYNIEKDVPELVVQYLKAGANKEIPESLKIGSSALALSANILLGTNRTALNGAATEAEKHGYSVIRLTSRLTGEAKELARTLSAIGADAKEHKMLGNLPLCIISGGEPIVTIQGTGKGGRNQEMALAFLREMQKCPDLYEDIHFLAASTDGNDGPTDAAGAFANLELLQRCRDEQLDITEYLHNNDSYNLFDKIGGLCKTGPTNTNVCDLHFMLIL